MPTLLSSVPRSLMVRGLCVVTCTALAAACGRPSPPPVEPPASLSFHTTREGAALWLATPFAVELKSEGDARMLELFEPVYVGEIRVGGEHISSRQLALIPASGAQQGATHYRVVAPGSDCAVEVLLYRIEPARWSWLPKELRPASASRAPLSTGGNAGWPTARGRPGGDDVSSSYDGRSSLP